MAVSPPQNSSEGGTDASGNPILADIGVYLRNDTRRVLYQATFVTEKDTWQEVRLPWSAFVPTSFGRQVTAPPVDPSAIRAMSLLIEFKQQGPFALEVKHIGAFEE